MAVFLVRPGFALAWGNGTRALWSPLGSGGSSGGGSGSAIPAGAAGHWDASALAGMLDANGNPVIGWNLNVSAVLDQIGAQNLSAYSAGATATLPQSTPRLNGLLGGLGLSTVVPPNAIPAAGQYLPVMAPDQGFQLPGKTFGASEAWTWYLVWSRPNWRQGSTAPVALLTTGTVPIVTLDSTGTDGTLHLFPTGADVALSAAVTRRHTHALIVTNTPGSGVSAWLDGVSVATDVASPLPFGGVMTLLHDTTAGGGAQCWFHEAAYWPSVLDGADIATLATASARWTLGARKGVTVAVVGQSNSVNGYNAGAWHLLAQGVAWYLGALAYNVAASVSQTLIGGVGIYPVVAPDPGAGFAGTFLINPGNGSDPMTAPWALDTASGAIGAGCESYFGGLSAADLGDVVALWWPWSENDSCRLYSEKTTLNEAQQRAIELVRGFIGQDAAALPFCTWNAMPFPYGNDAGEQAMRESEYDLTQLPGGNAVIALVNTCDVNPLGATLGPDGTISGGDYWHINTPDLPKLGMRAAALTARAVLASSGGDTISSFPSGVIASGGPRIAHVYQQSGTEYVLTITHDTGTSLIVPQQAVNGVGFALMDGGSLASTPGRIILATACSVVDDTHLLVTLAAAPSNDAASCLFYYPYGASGGVGPGGGLSGSGIGSGNAVTDNASSVAAPAGWDIGNQLLGTGSVSWAMNYPLAATTYGLAVSTSPT